MTPMLGIMASQISGHLTSYAYDSIQTVTVGSGGQATISFTSIPATYTHLQIRTFTNTLRTSNPSGSAMLQYNSDTTATNYYTHSLYGNGATVSAFGANENDGVWWLGDTTTNVVSVIDILDYANTNKYKTTRILTGYDKNGSGYVGLTSLLWKNTGAISTITFANGGSGNYNQYTTCALYGIK